MNKKTKLAVLFLIVLCLVSAAAFYLVSLFPVGTVAVIRLDGQEIERIDLSAVKESYDIPINTKYGYNLVHVAQGSISVTEANCPDGVCVRQGAISTGGVPIVCMPHRLTISIEGSGIDA